MFICVHRWLIILSGFFLFGEEDGDVGVDLVFGAHFTVLVEERHIDDGIAVAVVQSIMPEQSAQWAGSAQEQHPARFQCIGQRLQHGLAGFAVLVEHERYPFVDHAVGFLVRRVHMFDFV